MAEDIVAGLFGLDPNDLRDVRQKQAEQAATNFAQLDPYQRSNYLMFRGGQGIAQLGAGMLGMQDPRMVEAKQNESLQSQIDHSTPEGLLKGAAMFNQAGNAKMAYMYTLAAQKQKAQQSQLAKEAAQTNLADVQANELPQMRHEEKLAQLKNQELQINNQRLAAEAMAQNAAASTQQRADAAQAANELKAQQIQTQKDIAQAVNDTKLAIAEMGQNKPLTPAQQLKQHQLYRKDLSNKKALTSTLDATITNIDNLIGSEDGKIKEHKGLAAATGSVDTLFPTVLQDTKDAQAFQESLLSKASMEGLSTIRSQGGAIGSITEREWPILQALKATLQASQGLPQYHANLKAYRDELKRIKNDAEAAFNAEYQDSTDPPITPDITHDKLLVPKDKKVIRTGTHNGKKVIQYSDGSMEYAK